MDLPETNIAQIVRIVEEKHFAREVIEGIHRAFVGMHYVNVRMIVIKAQRYTL